MDHLNVCWMYSGIIWEKECATYCYRFPFCTDWQYFIRYLNEIIELSCSGQMLDSASRAGQQQNNLLHVFQLLYFQKYSSDKQSLNDTWATAYYLSNWANTRPKFGPVQIDENNQYYFCCVISFSITGVACPKYCNYPIIQLTLWTAFFLWNCAVFRLYFGSSCLPCNSTGKANHTGFLAVKRRVLWERRSCFKRRPALQIPVEIILTYVR